MTKNKTDVNVDNISHKRLTPFSITTIVVKRLNILIFSSLGSIK